MAASLRFAAVPVNCLNTHAARDIYRALALLHLDHPPLSGAELYFGGRVPGFFYYLLTAIPLAIWSTPWSVALWMALLGSLAAGITYHAMRWVSAPTTALAASLGYATFPLALIEGLYLWNPVYLPFISSVALWGLCYWLGTRRGTGFAVCLTAGLLGLQVHLSAYVILAVAVLVLIAMGARGKSGRGIRGARLRHVLLAFLIALPFVFPYLWSRGQWLFFDVTPGSSEVPAGLTSWRLNPHALLTGVRALVFRDDTGSWAEFIHFRRFFRYLLIYKPGQYVLCRTFGHVVSLVGFGTFFLLGFANLIAITFLPGANPWRRSVLVDGKIDTGAARPLGLALLAWLIIPMLVVLKMTGSTDSETPLLGIPTRYFVIYYPVSMVVTGLGFSWAFHRAASSVRLLVGGVFGCAVLIHAVIFVAFLQFAYRTASVFDALHPGSYVKPLFVEAALSNYLANVRNVSETDFAKRTLTDGSFSMMDAEQYLDLSLFEGKGTDRHANPKHWYYLYDTEKSWLPPLIPESGRLVDRFEYRQFRILVIEREDPTKPVVWPEAQLLPPGAR